MMTDPSTERPFQRIGLVGKTGQPFDQPDGFVVGEYINKLDDIEPERVAAQVSTVLQRVSRAVG